MIIQKYARRHLAKKELEKRRKQKQDYDELMDRIQKEVNAVRELVVGLQLL